MREFGQHSFGKSEQTLKNALPHVLAHATTQTMLTILGGDESLIAHWQATDGWWVAAPAFPQWLLWKYTAKIAGTTTFLQWQA